MPFLDQFLDDNPIQVPIGDAYKAVLGNVPVIIMKFFYVNEGMCITCDEYEVVALKQVSAKNS